MSDNSSLLLNFRSGKCFGCLNHLGLEILTSPTLSRVRTVSRSLVVELGDMFCVLWSRSWHVFLLRSRGMSVAAPSVVGVSQLLLSDSTLRECELLRFFNFRRLAMNPLSGELRPMLESRGRSAGRGQSRAVRPLSRGELQLLWRLMGEKRPQSAVRGVVRVGVDRRPPASPSGWGVVRARGVLSESTSRGDRRALRPAAISELNSRNLGVLRDSCLGVVRMSVVGDIILGFIPRHSRVSRHVPRVITATLSGNGN